MPKRRERRIAAEPQIYVLFCIEWQVASEING